MGLLRVTVRARVSVRVGVRVQLRLGLGLGLGLFGLRGFLRFGGFRCGVVVRYIG